MIGLSLSFCVRDVLSGKVDIKSVEKVYANCQVNQQTFYHYRDNYWREYTADQINKVLFNLFGKSPVWNSPKLISLVGDKVINISSGHWVKSESEIIWMSRRRRMSAEN